ncbi:coiled-coil-helix-coiled-coil-helix domain-containing protein 1-like [Amphibalanus amphitrite]|uniref:coiled-coil-helix-coiled-coil-helix domain-containing protein 1-like n=1 Tax=Amphibalanus amphitrite TaxID=1232801 RepID=UPI001C92A3B1|nr:coiled-coil-helix-coiled-coil-helix domain-containing protein 1-like [Amphibalanus amphitrite]
MRGSAARFVARGPGREPVPFKPVKGLALTDQITDRKDRYGALACVQEMQAMFACWKKYDHNEIKCSKELQAFENCHQTYLKERDAYMKRSTSSEGVLGHGSGRKLTARQANVLLKQYPNPR